MNELHKKLLVSINCSLLDALKQMDSIGRKLLIVIDGNDRYVSLLSVGDIQRAIIANNDLSISIHTIIGKGDKITAGVGDNIETIKKKMLALRAEYMPIISAEKQITDIILWEDVFFDKKDTHSDLQIPIVIMAGGKGTRLKPLTNVLPKPLIPIGEKTIIEEIMDRFVNAGCDNFFISVNYKAEMIKHYFSTLNSAVYNIQYFEEEKPLGTVGSLYLLKNKIKSTFFVSNCDIIIDQDLEEIYKYHKENNNTITLVSVLKHYKIPYGIIDTGDQGLLIALSEKPELTFQINSGMYLIEPEMLDEIPENTFLHITELIERVQKSGRNIGVFPVSEGSWRDIGEWNEYKKVMENFK